MHPKAGKLIEFSKLAGCACSRARTRLQNAVFPVLRENTGNFTQNRVFWALNAAKKARSLSVLAVEFPTRTNREIIRPKQGISGADQGIETHRVDADWRLGLSVIGTKETIGVVAHEPIQFLWLEDGRFFEGKYRRQSNRLTLTRRQGPSGKNIRLLLPLIPCCRWIARIFF